MASSVVKGIYNSNMQRFVVVLNKIPRFSLLPRWQSAGQPSCLFLSSPVQVPSPATGTWGDSKSRKPLVSTAASYQGSCETLGACTHSSNLLLTLQIVWSCITHVVRSCSLTLPQNICYAQHFDQCGLLQKSDRLTNFSCAIQAQQSEFCIE